MFLKLKVFLAVSVSEDVCFYVFVKFYILHKLIIIAQVKCQGIIKHRLSQNREFTQSSELFNIHEMTSVNHQQAQIVFIDNEISC